MSEVRANLNQVSFSVSYALDKNIRYRVADIEKAFQKVVNGQATSTNVPDTMPPLIPRFTLHSGGKQIAISQVSAQLVLNFEDTNKLVVEVLEIAQKNLINFWDGLCKLKTLDERKELGLVLTFHIPSKAAKPDVVDAIQKRYSLIPKLGDFASYNVQAGYLDPEKEIYKNVAVGMYEIREGSFEKPISGQVNIDLDQLDITEYGIEVKLDVNTRPMVKTGKAASNDVFNMLIEELKKLVFIDAAGFLNW